MIYRPFTIDRETLLHAIHQLTEGPPGLVVRMNLAIPDEPAPGPPRRVLQATLTGGTINFDIVDGAELKAILANRRRKNDHDG